MDPKALWPEEALGALEKALWAEEAVGAPLEMDFFGAERVEMELDLMEFLIEVEGVAETVAGVLKAEIISSETFAEMLAGGGWRGCFWEGCALPCSPVS